MKNYRVFISQATAGVYEKDFMMQRNAAVKMMTDYLKDEDPDISVKFIDTYTKDGLRENYPAQGISSMVDVDIMCFVGDMTTTASECGIYWDACDTYNIPYVHLTDFAIAEFMSCESDDRLNICPGDKTRVYKFVPEGKLFVQYIVDTKNTPKYSIHTGYHMRVDAHKLRVFISDYIYMIATLIESGLIDNLHDFYVIEDDVLHSDILYRKLIMLLCHDKDYRNTVITLCDKDDHIYKDLKAVGFIDMTGTWLEYENASVMLFTRDNTLLRYIYELSFMFKSQSSIANMNLPSDIIRFHTNAMIGVMNGDSSNECGDRKDTV